MERPEALQRIISVALRDIREAYHLSYVRVRIGDQRGLNGKVTRIELAPDGLVRLFVAFPSRNGKRTYDMRRRRAYRLQDVEPVRFFSLKGEKHEAAIIPGPSPGNADL